MKMLPLRSDCPSACAFCSGAPSACWSLSTTAPWPPPAPLPAGCCCSAGAAETPSTSVPSDVTTSMSATMAGCWMDLSVLISRVSVRGKPSPSWCGVMRLSATLRPVTRSTPRNTLPYVPSPICSTIA